MGCAWTVWQTRSQREAEDHAYLWMEELTSNWKQRVLQAEEALNNASYLEDRAVEELTTLHQIEQKVEHLRSMGLKWVLRCVVAASSIWGGDL